MYALVGVLGLTSLTSCKDDDKGPAPTAIEASSFTTESSPGAVKISWTNPANANHKYVRVTFIHPETKKQIVRLASIHADYILIDGLLGRYGEIAFTLTPVSKTGVEGKSHTVSAAAQPLPKTIKVNLQSEKAQTFVADGEGKSVWVSTLQVGEGSLAELFDGNPNTYYHGQWSNGGNGPMPHYIVLKLEQPTRAFKIFMKARHNKAADAPKTFNFLVSNTFSEENVKNPSQHNAVKVAEYASGPANTNGSEWNSPVVQLDEPFVYVWIEIHTLHSGKNWPTLAELRAWTYKLNSFDPETGETVEI